MASSPLRFAPFDESVAAPNVVVDGSSNPETVLVLSHWPGVPAPPACAADSSTQMAFRYLDRGADLHAGAELVTNNHFDQDGLAGVYALTVPEDALRRRELVEGLAHAGDFAVCQDLCAARLSMAVAALADPERSPLGALPDDDGARCEALYRSGLELLPGWLADPESCRSLWEEEDGQLQAGLAAVASGSVGIVEDPELDLAIVTLPVGRRSSGHRFVHRTFHGVHPIALHAVAEQTTLLTIDPDGGRHHLTCRYEGWVQFRSRPIRPRVDLRPLALRLDDLETAGARWKATGPDDLTPELFTAAEGPASSLAPPDLVGAVTEHLRLAPPAWDPYRVEVHEQIP